MCRLTLELLHFCSCSLIQKFCHRGPMRSLMPQHSRFQLWVTSKKDTAYLSLGLLSVFVRAFGGLGCSLLWGHSFLDGPTHSTTHCLAYSRGYLLTSDTTDQCLLHGKSEAAAARYTTVLSCTSVLVCNLCCLSSVQFSDDEPSPKARHVKTKVSQTIAGKLHQCSLLRVVLPSASAAARTDCALYRENDLLLLLHDTNTLRA